MHEDDVDVMPQKPTDNIFLVASGFGLVAFISGFGLLAAIGLGLFR
jgi:hypothetical protein